MLTEGLGSSVPLILDGGFVLIEEGVRRAFSKSELVVALGENRSMCESEKLVNLT